jgi:hypothetical protein
MLPWNMDCLLGFFVMGYILFPSLSVALLPGGGAMVDKWRSGKATTTQNSWHDNEGSVSCCGFILKF